MIIIGQHNHNPCSCSIQNTKYNNFKTRRIRERLLLLIRNFLFPSLVLLCYTNNDKILIKADRISSSTSSFYNLKNSNNNEQNNNNKKKKQSKKEGYRKKNKKSSSLWYDDDHDDNNDDNNRLLSSSLSSTASPFSSILSALKMNIESKIIDNDDGDDDNLNVDIIEEVDYSFSESDDDDDDFNNNYRYDDALLYDDDENEDLQYFEDQEEKKDNIMKESEGRKKMKILPSWISSQLPIKPFNAKEDDKKNISSEKMVMVTPSSKDNKDKELPPSSSKKVDKNIKEKDNVIKQEEDDDSKYCSSGYWETIDKISSLGLSSYDPNYRLSKKLRAIRKKTASLTGLHGVLSGKQHGEDSIFATATTKIIEEEKLGMIRRRLLAIERARERIKENIAVGNEQQIKGRRWRAMLSKSIQSATNLRKEMLLDITPISTTTSDNDEEIDDDDYNLSNNTSSTRKKKKKIMKEEKERKLKKEEMIKHNERIRQINMLIENNQLIIQQLQIEKDYLSNNFNPLYNYTSTTTKNNTDNYDSNSNSNSNINNTKQQQEREFYFPSDEMVEDYINNLMNQGRISKMNHTSLWRESNGHNDDDITTASTTNAAAAERYNNESSTTNTNGNAAVTSWILRQTIIGSGRNRVTIGEKISDIVEISTYKAICSSLMSILARSLASVHGLNIMTHADICLHVIQQSSRNDNNKRNNNNNITQEVQGGDDNDNDNNINQENNEDNTIEKDDKEIIQKSRTKKKKKKKKKRIKNNQNKQQIMLFVETFLSHVQLAAPIVKLFPIVWQRSFIHNLLLLVIGIIEDFTKGIRLYILGYELRLVFQPISSNNDDNDIENSEYTSFLLNHFFSSSSITTTQDQDDSIPFLSTKDSINNNNNIIFSKEDFETIVQRIGIDLSKQLQFLDKWHERVLGGQILRDQIGMVISRIVLLIIEDILRSLDIDLWTSTRITASLNYLI